MPVLPWELPRQLVASPKLQLLRVTAICPVHSHGQTQRRSASLSQLPVPLTRSL